MAKDGQGEPREVPFSVLHRDAYSGIGTPERRVVKSADEWAALWRQLKVNHLPSSPPPAVDFSRDMLLLVTLGSRGSSGYGVAVERVERLPDRLRVHLVSHRPGERSATLCVMTAPCEVIRLPRTEAPLEFVERERVDK